MGRYLSKSGILLLNKIAEEQNCKNFHEVRLQ